MLAAIGLVLAVATTRAEPAVMVAPFLVTVAIGLAVGGRPSAVAALTVSPDRVLAGDEIVVTAVVRSNELGRRARLRLVPPEGVTSIEDDLDVDELLVDGEVSATWTMSVERWGAIGPFVLSAHVTDRLGLFESEARAEVARIRALPEEARLRRLLSPRSMRSVPGAHASRHRADGLEFADMRPFVPGDRARSVNWRVSARRGELWVDERHPERSGEVVLFLDSFTSLGSGRDDTLRRTVEAAKALADRHLAANDRVGLVDLGGVFRWVRPASGMVQLYRIAEALVDTEVWASVADKPLEVIPVRALPRRSLVVALSPLLDPRGLSTLVQMRGRGLDVVVLEVAPRNVAPPGERPRSRVARRLWSLEREMNRTTLRQHGIGVAEWLPDAPVDPVLDGLLAYREAVSRWAR
ncbi:MAG: DUF58 domain-containing protein [Acidimicrobiia bacterium]|nr:DUF58 domain-containing protein [Acidimicrobiia bacterium]